MLQMKYGAGPRPSRRKDDACRVRAEAVSARSAMLNGKPKERQRQPQGDNLRGPDRKVVASDNRRQDFSREWQRARLPPSNRSASSGRLEVLNVADHLRAHRGVGKPALEGAHVLGHVVDSRGGGNGACHCRMRDDELEEELRPVGAVNLAGKVRQRMPVEQLEQLLRPEWPVDDHREAAIGSHGQQSLFRLAIQDVVAELDEVDRLRRHHVRHGVVYGVLGAVLAQAVLASLGYWLAGVPAPFLLGLLTGFFGIIPGGPAIIWLPASIWLFRNDETAWGIFVVVWSAVLVGNIDNVIRPLFVAQGSALPLLLVLIGILGGAMAFGFIGIFLGPTVLAILYALMREWSPGDFIDRPQGEGESPNHPATAAPNRGQ